MKDIERELGIRPGSFYAAFASKEALYAETLNLYAENGANRLQALADKYSPLGALKANILYFGNREAPGHSRARMLAKTVL